MSCKDCEKKAANRILNVKKKKINKTKEIEKSNENKKK